MSKKVTIIEKLDGILPTVDDDIRSKYTPILAKDGIEILTSAEVKTIGKDSVTYLKDGKETTIKASVVLLSIGMKANSEGLEVLNLKLDRASVVTNEKLETSVPGVYAIGDLNGKYMLAHVASTEGLVAVENICGHKTTMDYTQIPSAIYGSPEIGMIGLTEKEAKAQGKDYKVSTFPLAANGRSLGENEPNGFIKIIFDKKYGEVLGAHLLAYNASELLGEIGVTMKLEGTAEEIAQTIHAHPTLSEIILEAAHGYDGKPIHI
jgi:dihydrolipoamide dehydrogenase